VPVTASVTLRRHRALTAFGYEPKLERAVAALERKRSTSSHDWALARLRVRSPERVRLHTDLTILAKLAGTLARARAVPLAA
jgi:hypothetical protein